MNVSVTAELDHFDKKVVNYLMKFQFRMADLVTDSDPASLLGVKIPDRDGGYYTFEEKGDVVKKTDDTLYILPKKPAEIMDIGKAIGRVHPEFKQDIVMIKKTQDSDEKSPIIILTMPPVDENRKKIILDAVDVLYKEFKVQLDYANGVTTAKVAKLLLSASELDKKEAAEEQKKVYDAKMETADNMKAKKEKEVEDAYKKYLEKQSGADVQKNEQAAANNPAAGLSMKMPN